MTFQVWLESITVHLLASNKDSICLYSRQSSVNKWQVEFMPRGRSFMNMRNSRGPSIEPCETPLITLAGSEIQPSHTTCCVRSCRNEVMPGLLLLCYSSLKGCKNHFMVTNPWN